MESGTKPDEETQKLIKKEDEYIKTKIQQWGKEVSEEDEEEDECSVCRHIR